MSTASDMKCIVILTTILGLTLSLTKDDPLVTTNVGTFRGIWDDNGFSKFLGVPYGLVGENIFGAGEPHPVLDEIFDANDDTRVCVRLGRHDNGIPVGTIQCLNMNIYVPDSASAENRLPVMVWIHGGAFISGSAVSQAAYPLSLLRHDVIVIAINYRFGVFGFMCLDIPEVPGNTGLKDQVLALRWIKQNIEAFGGDADKITVFGESAGGMSANLHLFSPHEKLFDKIIIQSGPATSYWMMVESAPTVPIMIAEQLGFNTTDIYEALEFLRATEPHTTAIAAADLEITTAVGINQPLTKPCVEKEFEGVDHFLTEHPMNMFSSKASTTPTIIGYNNIEIAFQLANIAAEYFDTYEFSEHFALGFDMDNDLSEALEVVKHFYVGDEINESARWNIIDFASDFVFKHPSQRMAQRLLESGAPSVYAYVFSYVGSNNINDTWPGATHTDELIYLFDFIEPDKKSPEDQLLIDRLTELWTNFAKYGDPTPSTSDIVPLIWTPITATTYPFLAIDSNLNLEDRPFKERMAFWDLFYMQYGHYQKWYKP